jgi:tRNA threonylcarbamoyladenosine biosynthesis protein TsaE
MVQIETLSPDSTVEFGECIGRILQPGDILCLSGQLGAGKTHLAKGIARGLEIKEEVTSPTYTIMQMYQGSKVLYHFDLYRLECADQLQDIGFDEFIYGRGVSLVEWAEKFPEAMPREYLHIQMLYDETQDTVRVIKIQAVGTRFQQRLEELRQSCMC